MTDLQLELTKLIGSKELSFGCEINARGISWRFLRKENLGEEFIFFYSERKNIESLQSKFVEIIGHPATLSDLHRWITNKFRYWFRQEYNKYSKHIIIRILDDSVVRMDNSHQKAIKYDSSLDLLDQSEETLKEIIDFIKANQ